MRLLICEAQKLLLDSLSMALMGNGYTVVATASDPDEAVAAAREYQPDACLLDVSFPLTKGLSAIARIHEASAGTKVVMLCGSVDGGLLAGAMAEGAEGFVGEEKPIRSVVQALEMA
ncbi:MAG TPA: response regulator transcription factor, partial [Dermatophilaceae bacterium]|nr:response regulator transcription factor [Dermatophilaceae bacterium]